MERALHFLSSKSVTKGYRKMPRSPRNLAIHAAIFTFFLIAPSAISQNPTSIPADLSQVNKWFAKNVKPYTQRTGSIDPALASAEAQTQVIKVRHDGSGDFNSITRAIGSVSSGNKKRVIIWIGEGVYNEKIKIDRTKPFITFYGQPDAMPTLTFAGTAKEYGTVDSATLIVESDYFMAANIIISNSSPKPNGKTVGAQAAALRISGDKAAFYNCKIIGFQDTLCDDKGNHFFKDCYVEGTVDFIFGSGKSLYLKVVQMTELHVVDNNGFTVIAAQARENESEDNGYSFVHCNITGTTKGAYLGRAWKTRPRVVYSYTTMGKVVNPAGWSDNFHPERDKTVFYGEYKCYGPGSILTDRVKYTEVLTDARAQPFITLGYIDAFKWLLPSPQLPVASI